MNNIKPKKNKARIHKGMQRRAFLKGAMGSMILLPNAFSMLGNQVVMAADGDGPRRLITFYFPNGCDPEMWNFEQACSPLASLRNKIILLQGLDNRLSNEAGDDKHAQGGANCFTGARLSGPNNLASTKCRGESLDQFASPTLDVNTVLRQPLVTGVWGVYAGGTPRAECWYRRSWKLDPKTKLGHPVTPISNPLDIFNTLFGANHSVTDQSKQVLQKSILDAVVGEYRALTAVSSPLGADAKIILQDHLDKVRNLEQTVVRFAQDSGLPCRSKVPVPANLGSGLLSYDQFESAFQTQIDLTILAMQCGITHTASLMFGTAGSDYVNKNIAPNSDHGCSHWKVGGLPSSYHLAFRRFHMSNFAKLLNGLNAVPEGNGTLLDNTVVIAGSEFGQGEHIASPQPHLVAGGGSALRLGQVIDVGLSHTPSDLYRGVLKAVGISVPTYGEAKFNGADIPQLLV